MSEPEQIRRKYARLMCRDCSAITHRRGRSYETAIRIAAMHDPPARVTIAWRCEECGRMNRNGQPAQARLF